MNGRGATRLRTIALAVLALPLVIACRSVGQASVADASDVPDSAPSDAGALDVDTSDVEIDACAPEAVSLETLSPPDAAHRNACPGESLVANVVSCQFGAEPSAEICAKTLADPAFEACRACIFGPQDAGAGSEWATPIVVADSGIAELNIGACLELSANLTDSGPSRCPNLYHRQQECHRRACSHCAARGKAAYEECKALADEGTCAKAFDRRCGLELGDAGCDVGYDFLYTAYFYSRAFCLDTN